MSKEMLEAFRILKKTKGLEKKISSKPSQNHCVQLIAVVMDNQEKVQRLEFNENWDFRVYTVASGDEVFLIAV